MQILLMITTQDLGSFKLINLLLFRRRKQKKKA